MEAMRNDSISRGKEVPDLVSSYRGSHCSNESYFKHKQSGSSHTYSS